MAAALIVFAPSLPCAAQSSRVYVRRIEFVGVSQVNDEVLRRELLQLEATYLNTSALDRSLARLERLPYVASAVAALKPVDGNLELVDVEIRIVEAPARRYDVGGGYSGALRTWLHGYFVDENVAGTGQRFSIGAEGNELFHFGELTHTHPYARSAGVSRTIGVTSRRIDRLTVDSSSLDTDVTSARLEYSYRVATGELPPDTLAVGPAEAATPRGPWLTFGIELAGVDVTAGAGASDQLRRWVAAAADGSAAAQSPTEASFNAADFLLQWRSDTRDAALFPRSGREQTLALRSSLPGTDIGYYRLDYDATQHWPLGERWTATLTARLGIGGAYGNALPSQPPYMNWLAGGPSTVRGYRDGTLGPRDSGGRPYGGDLLVAAQAEWLVAWPRRWEDHLRTGFFYDVGNVFSAGDTVFFDEAGRQLDYSFDPSKLRHSIGIVARLRIPLGVLSVSYALGLDANTNATSTFHRDEVERLQLSVGVDF